MIGILVGSFSLLVGRAQARGCIIRHTEKRGYRRTDASAVEKKMCFCSENNSEYEWSVHIKWCYASWSWSAYWLSHVSPGFETLFLYRPGRANIIVDFQFNSGTGPHHFQQGLSGEMTRGYKLQWDDISYAISGAMFAAYSKSTQNWGDMGYVIPLQRGISDSQWWPIRWSADYLFHAHDLTRQFDCHKRETALL